MTDKPSIALRPGLRDAPGYVSLGRSDFILSNIWRVVVSDSWGFSRFFTPCSLFTQPFICTWRTVTKGVLHNRRRVRQHPILEKWRRSDPGYRRFRANRQAVWCAPAAPSRSSSAGVRMRYGWTAVSAFLFAMADLLLKIKWELLLAWIGSHAIPIAGRGC